MLFYIILQRSFLPHTQKTRRYVSRTLFTRYSKAPVFYFNTTSTYLKDTGEILPGHVVVGLQEDVPQRTLPDRVVLRVELVETEKRVAVLFTIILQYSPSVYRW